MQDKKVCFFLSREELRDSLSDGMALKLSLKKELDVWKAGGKVFKAEGTAFRCTGSEIENSLFQELKEAQCSWSRVNRERAAQGDEKGGQGAECAGPCTSGKDCGYFTLKTVRGQRRILNWEQHYPSMGSRN